ncbi:hypothetical protein ACIQUB_07145 [Rhizobium sp. NPDC090275]|uniref:hypothetical protein n=1 Tax=Rhizobium sp. NPDC090275 TaxID=3364498 RepID=UPI00383A66C4
MHLQDRLVKIDELAQALGRKEDWIKRNWLRMHQKDGMPRKVPSAWAWPRKAMEAWLEGAIAPQAAEAPEPPAMPLAVIAANENARLRAKYSGGRA